jgi:hypothetical protein
MDDALRIGSRVMLLSGHGDGPAYGHTEDVRFEWADGHKKTIVTIAFDDGSYRDCDARLVFQPR